MVEMLFACVIAVTNCIAPDSTDFPADGVPLKYISSCEIDLNGDKVADIAMLVETVRGREFIVLMKSAEGYDTYVLYCGEEALFFSCAFGEAFVGYSEEDTTGTKRETYRTPGAFLELYKPEVVSIAYFWNGSGFTEVWTSD